MYTHLVPTKPLAIAGGNDSVFRQMTLVREGRKTVRREYSHYLMIHKESRGAKKNERIVHQNGGYLLDV